MSINNVLTHYEQYRNAARRVLNPTCRVCKVCNGIACAGNITNLLEFGGKGNNGGFQASIKGLRDISIDLDPIHEDYDPDTSCKYLNHSFVLPVFASPIGKLLTENPIESPYFNNNNKYADALVQGCYNSGGVAWLGDNKEPGYFEGQVNAIRNVNGVGIPTIKPWRNLSEVLRRIEYSKTTGAIAVAIDVDSIGLGYQYSSTDNSTNSGVCARSVSEMKEIIESAGFPIIIKGIMSVKAAEKARAAGAAGIVISNHGGNIIESSIAPCNTISKIRESLGREFLILADGGVRSGEDVFKLLALGADAVGIGRPYAISVYGGGQEGVENYTQKIHWELKNIMTLANCEQLTDITCDKLIHHSQT